MTDRDIRVLVCSVHPGLLDTQARHPIQGDCGHLVYVSRSGVVAQLAGTVNKIMCTDCALRLGNLTLEGAVPGALEELAEQIGPKMARAVHHVGLLYAERLMKRKAGLN